MVKQVYSYIYLLTSKKTGKVYVGQSFDPKHRFRSHLRRSSDAWRGRFTKLHAALREEGIDGFSMKVIDVASSRDEANHKECYWIWKYKACYADKGYNGSWAGSAVPGAALEQGKVMWSRIRAERVKLRAEAKMIEKTKAGLLGEFWASQDSMVKEQLYWVANDPESLFRKPETLEKYDVMKK